MLISLNTFTIQVAKPVVAVAAPIPNDGSIDWSDFNGPLIVILVVVPSALAILAAVVLLYIHCRVTTWDVSDVCICLKSTTFVVYRANQLDINGL